MKTKVMLLIVAVVMSAMPVLTFAYPISPRPLRLLIEESELIVWAHVHDIRSVTGKRKHDFETTVVILTIQQVLQGTLTAVEIEVPYPAGLICPAPPHFEKGTDVLVFLDREQNGYSVHALSYGSKQLTGEEFAVYQARIMEMQEIIKIQDLDNKFLRTTEWLVKCAEVNATRHEGLYELSRGSDFMSFYDRNEGQPFQHALSDDQHLRLKSALLATPKLSYDELGLIDLVYASDAEQICKFMISGLKQFDEHQFWYAGEFMERINLYQSSPRSQSLAEAFREKSFDIDLKPGQLRGMLDEFLAEVERLME